MRFFTLVLGAMCLLAQAAGAQQLALSPAKTLCPPDDPDSLQISWNQPCEEGDWLLDTQAGCRMWDWHPDPDDAAVWKGACHAGLPDGRGQAQWFEHGRPIDRFEGAYRDGKREGQGRYTWNPRVSFEGTYADDVPQGRGTVKIEGVVLSGDWNKGCLVQSGKVVAIGVPRTSCGPASAKIAAAD